MRALAETCCAIVVVTIVIFAQTVSARADERVTFNSAHYVVGNLQQRLARERGEAPKAKPAEAIQGYLSKPEGNGPFPAVVYLHGCDGLTDAIRKSVSKQLTGWGYVALVVDSFATRGITNACITTPPDRLADAFGALIYLSKLPFVDPKRVALVGHSQGGMAALRAASFHPFDLFELPTGLNYKAAVAFYPQCDAAEDQLSLPTLILIGELDEWSPPIFCDWWLKRRGGRGAPVTLIVYPEAFHGFDNAALRGGMKFTFGHWVKYDPDATERSAAEMQAFLANELSR